MGDRLLVIAARVGGASLLGVLVYGWVEALTDQGVARLLRVQVPHTSVPEATPGQLVAVPAFFLALLVAGRLAVGSRRFGLTVLKVLGLVALALGLPWLLLCAGGTPRGHLATLDYSFNMLLWGLIWSVAGASLGWQGGLPPAIERSRGLSVLCRTLVFVCALLLLAAFCSFVGMLAHAWVVARRMGW